MSKHVVVVIADFNAVERVPLWASHAIAYLRKQFATAGVALEVVDKMICNEKGAHPSWYKLLLHRHFKGQYDFILCWDLDLLPKSPESIQRTMQQINTGRLFLTPDSLITHHGRLHAAMPGNCERFRWNCGLIGIPRNLAEDLALLYEAHAPGERSSWEQFYVNDWLFENERHTQVLKEGSGRCNVMVNSTRKYAPNPPQTFAEAINIHYSVHDKQEREELIIAHCSGEPMLY